MASLVTTTINGTLTGNSSATFDSSIRTKSQLRVSNDYSINYFYKTNNTTMLGYLLMRDDNNSFLSFPAAQDFRFLHGNTSRIAVKTDGNVGIGNTNPQGKLDINTELAEPTHVYINGEVNQNKLLYFRHYANSEAAANNVALGYIGSNGIDNLLSLGHLNSSGTDVPIMHLTEAGNVGIGTTSPSQKLHVNGLTKLGASGKTEGGAIIGLSSFGETKGVLSTILGNSIVPGTANSTIQRSTSNIAHFLKINETSGITFHTGLQTTEDANVAESTNEKVRIDITGKVGIGTTAPSKKLDVNGDVKIAGDTLNAGFLQAYGSNFNVGNNNYGVFLGTYSGGTNISPGEVILSTQGKTGWDVGDGLGRIRFFLGDASGIGARDVAKIEAVSETGNGSTSTTASGALTFYTSPYNSQVSERVRIDKDGNVGIGTTSPDSKLHLYEAASAPSLLTLHNNVADILNDGSTGNFIDFKSTDANATFTPQARIGMVVQDQAGDGGIASEGHGNFVVYTAVGTDALGNGTLSEKLRVNHDGNVGIGTPSPNSLLNLNDGSNNRSHQIGFSYVTGGTKTDAFTIGRNSSTGNLEFHSDMNNHGFEFKHNAAGTRVFNILNMNVGIGTVTPSTKLEVVGETKSTNYRFSGPSDGGAVPAYSNSSYATVKYNEAERATELVSSSDEAIGMAFPAFRVNESAGEQWKLWVQYKASASSSTGFYARIYEYSAELPDGKIAVSNSASNPVVQEDTSSRTDWKDNVAISTTWVTSTYTYTPNSNAKWASIVLLNWTGMGYNSLYARVGKERFFGTSSVITGSGTVNKLPLWDGTSSLTDSRVSQTASSIEILGASGQGYSKLLLKPDTGASLSLLELSHGPDPNNASVVIYGRGDSSYATINSTKRGTGVTKPINFDIDSNEKMRIDTSGNVGISATTPTGKLQIGDNYTINASYGGDDIYIKGTANKASYDPNVYNTDDIGALITISDSGTVGPTKPGLVLYNDDVTAGGFSPMLLFSKRESGNTPYKATMAGIYARAPLGTGDSNGWIDGELIFATAGAASHGVKQRMVINKEGLVGIGAISPDEKLHIGSGASETTNSFVRVDGNASKQKGFNIYGDGTEQWRIYTSTSSSDLRFYDGSNVTVTFEDGGNVGIGTTNPGVTLDVRGKLSIGSPNASYDLYNNGTTYLNDSVIIDAPLNIVGDLTFDGGASRDILFGDNLGAALEFKEGSNVYQRFITTNGGEKIELYKTTTMAAGATISGQLLLSDGSVGAPSLSFINDTNTGMWRPGSDQLRLATGGTDAIIIDSSQRVGIATAPSQALTVAGKIDAKNAMGVAGQWSSSQIRLETTNTVDTTGWHGISFDASTSANYGWSLGVNRSSSGRGSFRFYEHVNSATGTERFTIEQDGNVGIGIADPNYKLHTVGGAGVFDVTGAATLNHHLAVTEVATLPDWRPYSGTTTAALQIQSSATRGILLAAKSTGNQDFYNTEGLDIYVSSTVGSSSSDKGTLAMSILSGGNVGINTTTPTSKLQIVGSTSGDSVLKVDGTNGTLFEVVDDLSDSLMSVNDAAGLPVFEVFADNTIVGGRYNQNDFYLQGSSGKIGIGTATNINTKLLVEGDATVNGDLSAGGSAAANRTLTLNSVAQAGRPAAKINNPNLDTATASDGRTFHGWLPIDLDGTVKYIPVYN